MTNQELSKLFALYGKLYELHGGNSFKVKSIANFVFFLKKFQEPFFEMEEAQILSNLSFHKGFLPKLIELKETGTLQELELLIEKTPKGVVDLLNIKGLGPKKVEVLWKEVGIASVVELLEACRENRLVEIKGFGHKTQTQILSDIEFKYNQEGKFHWAKVEPIALQILEVLNSSSIAKRAQVTGEYRRLDEIVIQLEYVVEPDSIVHDWTALSVPHLDFVELDGTTVKFKYAEVLNVVFHLSNADDFESLLFETTATESHLNLIHYTKNTIKASSEVEIYKSLGFDYILPELREGLSELKNLDKQSKLIEYKDLKGVIHNHTTYSDGLHTLKEMYDFANESGFEYLVICDHSQSAGYAGGLKPDRVKQQFDEIDKLNKGFNGFKVYKGIESDILTDGSLDYEEDLLSQFEVIVASVHSQLTMDEEKAHKRLIKAIEHPRTRILGHPTGRLLLMRPGYSINHQYILDACLQNKVVVELNAHPYRLDIDWRWIDYYVSKGGIISINPDAHHKDGYLDMRYGVNVARKAYLTPEFCLNAKDLIAFDTWVKNK
jgi:DNA polymerase (family 10)